MSVAVAARDLFFLYRTPHGDVPALRGLSLEVAEGEAVAVLGPSGSGKTTLLGLCSGSLRPSSGTLTVLGRRDLGVVRQHYHRTLPRELTAEEIVALPLRLAGTRHRAALGDARTLLATAGLADHARARPEDLSGGEQQRVAVCAALVRRPRLLLADEPTGELDAESSSAVVELMLALAAESLTAALIVTHDPQVALRAGRTIHIRDGRLAAEGTTRPALVIDEQGWLRLPRRVREQAGLGERVRAQPSWGKVELVAEDPVRWERPPVRVAPREKRGDAEIALDRVTKRYAAAPVLDALSWTFAAEHLHVAAGPSGTGKTTLLNLIAALEYPDEGEVWVGGERVDSLARGEAAHWRRRTLGYLSQHSTLVEFLSARENVRLALAVRGFDEAESARRADRWLEWVGLAQLADRRADRLSGGEQRRVAVARAVAAEPRVLVADEPTAHLDRVTGRLVIRLLQQAAHELGATVLAATHDSDLIAAADARLLLGSGARRVGHEQRPRRRRPAVDEP